MERRKLTVLALGAVGLAAALTVAALVAPGRGTGAPTVRTPASADEVIAEVPKREAAEVAARRELAASPERVELAVELARADVARYRQSADPRYLGRAEATLARWWTLPAPPADVRFLRATIAQSTHDFAAARADLDALAAASPTDVAVQLERAVVATVTGDYAAARESCRAIAAQVAAVVVAACEAPLDDPAPAFRRLAREIAADAPVSIGVQTWARTTLAELAIRNDELPVAEEQLRRVLAIDGTDAYALGLLADVLVATGRASEASKLLAGREANDNLLVRRAIAEHEARGPNAADLAGQVRGRIAEAAVRGDRVHVREEARFALEIDGDAPRALRLAQESWGVQKELADARLLVEAALAAKQPAAAEPVRTWRMANRMIDAQLDRMLARLR